MFWILISIASLSDILCNLSFFRQSGSFCISDVLNRSRRWTLWCSSYREEAKRFAEIIKCLWQFVINVTSRLRKVLLLVHSRHCLLSSTQTVETLNCTIERTETPPYFRLTSLRKASSNSESNMLLTSSRQDLNALGNEGAMKGTIHTKRHSQQDASDQQREGWVILL